MSINNSREFLAHQVGLIITDHRVTGRNVQLDPGTYPPLNWDDYPTPVDSVTFAGTSKGDTLFAGGGELFAFFMGTRGDDLYGVGPSPGVYVNSYVDYSGSRSGVFVDMSYRGTRSFTDADGETRTVNIVGKAQDGLGGTDFFAQRAGSSSSSIFGIFGSSHHDVIIDSFNAYGAGGNDLIIGGVAYGGTGSDTLVGRDGWAGLFGDEGNDWIFGVDNIDGESDAYLIGGPGNDHIFAGAGDDGYVTGDKGNDFIDGGAGNDFIDGGVGRDTLLSGAGNDIINPDVEFFQLDPTQARDGARDVIHVTRADLGDFTDVVLSRAFEADRDQVRFADAVRGGADFRVFQEAQSFDPDTDRLLRADDQADLVNTVLQIDRNGDGFGGATPDASDYFLVVVDADLSLHHGYLLT